MGGTTQGSGSEGWLREVAARAAARALDANEASGRSRLLARPPFADSPAPPSETARSHSSSASGGVAPGVASNSDLYAREAPGPAADARERDLVTEALVSATPEGGDLVVPPRAHITPLARELAFARGVRFLTGRHAEPLGAAAPGAVGRRSRRIAVASDHGGFALKQELVTLLRELGHRPVDLGPASGDVSVDYPDFAARVATEVSEGRADLGVLVDGAGIGSAMVANKVPGVLAANCWDVRTARNAREHNHANVLTLGAGHLDLAAARDVVAAFLATGVGEGRHQRRADLTRAVEAEHLRVRHLTQVHDDER